MVEVLETSAVTSSEQAPELNRQDVLVLESNSGEATETASECGSDSCSMKTASEIEMFL